MSYPGMPAAGGASPDHLTLWMNYADRWSDYSTTRCEAEVAEHGAEVTLPNGVKVAFTEEALPIDWRRSFDTDVASTRLWFRSLAYLPALTEASNGWMWVSRIVEDFHSFMIEGARNPAHVQMRSFDHALAIAMRVCCELYIRALAVTETDRVRIQRTIESLVPLLATFARRPGIRGAHNHGVMVSIGLIHCAAIFPHYFDEGVAQDDVEVALKQFETVIDGDGFAYENTPAYQRLYLSLLSDILEFEKCGANFFGRGSEFQGKFAAAELAFRRMLLPGGLVPPIGDGNLGRETLFSPLPGRTVSTSNGFFVLSNETDYVAVTCGARSAVHKQMDDTAVRMAIDGEMVVLDAGLLNYDSDDAVGRAVRTQLGHSGLFFPRFDREPLSFFNSGGDLRRVKASMRHRFEDDVDTLDCLYEFDGYRARRRFRVSSPLSVEIVDQCWSLDGASAVARFLLPASMDVSVLGAALCGEGDYWVEISVVGRPRFHISRGTVALKPYVAAECWLVEIEVPSGGMESAIVLKAGRKD